MADQEDSGLLREIDEELRQDQFTAVARKYGKYAVAGAVLLIAGVGGFKAWESYERDMRMEATSAYLDAVTLADNDDAAAANSLADLAADGTGHIKLLANMRRARLLAENGDIEGAVNIYQKVAADTAAPEEYRGLASLYLATLLLDEGDVGEARSLAATMTDAGSPYQFAALELTALADIESGDAEAARGSLNTIVDAADAPQGLRSRAAVLLRTLPDGGNDG